MRDGIKIAYIENRGKGEENLYQWLNQIDKLDVLTFAQERFPHITECYMDALIDEMLATEKRDLELAQMCKKKLIFRLTGDKPGVYRSLNVPYTSISEKWLKTTYGDRVEEITNSRLWSKLKSPGRERSTLSMLNSKGPHYVNTWR
jgi:hypothetical protein